LVTIAWLTMIGDPWIKTGNVAPSFKSVEDIVLSRCSMCHADEPVWAGITAPPHDVRLDNADEIRRHGSLIQIWAVQSRAMPPGNITEMTDQERSTLAAWRAEEAPSWLHCPSFLCGNNQP
jgi:uncharacterized membrane protein